MHKILIDSLRKRERNETNTEKITQLASQCMKATNILVENPLQNSQFES